MARSAFTALGPHTFDVTGFGVNWGSISVPIPASLTEADVGSVTLSSMILTEQGNITLDFHDLNQTNRDLSAAWEDSPYAVAFRVPGTSVRAVIPGPGAADRDDPYTWGPLVQVTDLLTAYRALSAAQQAALEISIGTDALDLLLGGEESLTIAESAATAVLGQSGADGLSIADAAKQATAIPQDGAEALRVGDAARQAVLSQDGAEALRVGESEDNDLFIPIEGPGGDEALRIRDAVEHLRARDQEGAERIAIADAARTERHLHEEGEALDIADTQRRQATYWQRSRRGFRDLRTRVRIADRAVQFGAAKHARDESISISDAGAQSAEFAQGGEDRLSIADTESHVATRLPPTRAARAVIMGIPDGAEETDVALSVTLTGGNYARVEYRWRVSAGTLDNARAASPTWTRPAVDIDQFAFIELDLTFIGDGTNALGQDTARATASALVLPFIPTPGRVTGDARMVGWAVDIDGIAETDAQGDYTGDDVPYRLWSGEGTLTLGGETYKGVGAGQGSMARVSRVEDSIGSPTSRVTIDIAVPPSAVREMLDIDIGPVQVNLRYVTSGDNGATWTALPVGIQGQLSRPEYQVEGSIYTVEVETWSGDADRGQPKLWSHETQMAEHAGDMGFEFMRELSQGIEARWPP